MDIAWFSLLLLWLLVIIFSFHTVWQKSQLDKVLIILIGLAWVLTVWGGITQEYEIIEMGHIMFGITLGIMLFFFTKQNYGLCWNYHCYPYIIVSLVLWILCLSSNVLSKF